MKVTNLKDYRVRRHLRLRRKVTGTAERPRMSVFLSNKHAYYSCRKYVCIWSLLS